jgi:hypothetical protein
MGNEKKVPGDWSVDPVERGVPGSAEVKGPRRMPNEAEQARKDLAKKAMREADANPNDPRFGTKR